MNSGLSLEAETLWVLIFVGLVCFFTTLPTDSPPDDVQRTLSPGWRSFSFAIDDLLLLRREQARQLRVPPSQGRRDGASLLLGKGVVVLQRDPGQPVLGAKPRQVGPPQSLVRSRRDGADAHGNTDAVAAAVPQRSARTDEAEVEVPVPIAGQAGVERPDPGMDRPGIGNAGDEQRVVPAQAGGVGAGVERQRLDRLHRLRLAQDQPGGEGEPACRQGGGEALEVVVDGPPIVIVEEGDRRPPGDGDAEIAGGDLAGPTSAGGA